MNPFSRKKKIKVQAPTAPRELAEIQKEYQQLSLQAGQNQYQSYILAQDRARLNNRLREVNFEAAERNKLDALTNIDKAAKGEGPAVKGE